MTEPTEPTENSQLELGLLLQHQREKRNLTPNDVAAELKVLSSAVRGIENADYSVIKGDVFVKGYIRAYAEFLQLDVNACLNMYTAGVTDSPAAEKISAPLLGNESSNRVKIIAAALVAVVVVIIVTLSSGSDEHTEQNLEQSLPVEKQAAPAVLEENSIPAALDEAPAAVQSAEVVGEDTRIETVVTVVNVEPELDADTLLEISFTDDCWVEVRDAAAKSLLVDLKRKGDKVSLSGVPPYDVLMGNGHGVELSYAGQPIEFEVGLNPTVRLTIGSES